MTADAYFHPTRRPSDVPTLDDGRRSWATGELDGVYSAAPMFDPVNGVSPGGTDYRALGCSRHSRDVATMQASLLAN